MKDNRRERAEILRRNKLLGDIEREQRRRSTGLRDSENAAEEGHRPSGDVTVDGKSTNPKDVIGSSKLSTAIVPDTLVVCAAMGCLEGALKYGRYNWRVAGVRASIYVDALRRHVAKWWNGQDHDKLTTVHHLDNAIATLAILRDAMIYGKLEDDRPPCPNPDAMADLIDAQQTTIAHLKETFKAHSPYQFTIKDTQ